jgi:hypothetical protein
MSTNFSAQTAMFSSVVIEAAFSICSLRNPYRNDALTESGR